ncbi:MAG: type II toxin-antitoxin system death-on-curing family toxin [Pseudomonadota bacterium]
MTLRWRSVGAPASTVCTRSNPRSRDRTLDTIASLAHKSAALLHSVVNNHGFVDGNKRTAWLLVELLIERSGYYLDVPDDEPIDDLVVAVAEGSTAFEALQAWFAARFKRH